MKIKKIKYYNINYSIKNIFYVLYNGAIIFYFYEISISFYSGKIYDFLSTFLSKFNKKIQKYNKFSK